MTAKYLFYSAIWWTAIAVILVTAAGDPLWPQGWIYLVENAVLTAATVAWLAQHDPALLRERFAPPFHRDQASWDRVFIAAMMVGFAGWLVLMPLDARRYGWSHIPVLLQAAGALLILASSLVTWRTFRANTFGVPQARVQASRNQTVVTDGPYAIVRHPMYSGAFLYFVGMPLLLGSWLGLLGGLVLALLLAIRSVGEERMLHRELDGYSAYTRKVRWRMVPGIW